MTMLSFCPLSAVSRRTLGACAGWALLAPLGLGLQMLPVAPMMAAERVCNGTLLQIKVLERGNAVSDRFRFSLRLEAEASTKSAAMNLLNQRVDQARREIKPLAMGRLTIPAPRHDRIGGGAAGRRVERASTSISGDVSRHRYDALIQTAARLEGVRLQGMLSLASSSGNKSLAGQLLERALQNGRGRAELTANALGLRRVDLLRIDQRGFGAQPMAMASRQASEGYNPDEAPKPSQTLSLDLSYCLS
ncbi:SIMPL domain-containing protein [Synechococcus sp. UW105]|uniref:SIMPL domain-containing protein n=1 Tax=Synechococcus sp. UW105 TaxID=337067 RepID=UPI001FCB12B5|nr:SIMPL domain-containing protein [Synechococcus sp. UW105]